MTIRNDTDNVAGGSDTRLRAATMLNKVPEVTIWFWIIKILCTTVGESFADYINETLGFGLINTTVLFTVVFVVVLTVQMRLRRYVPLAYWLTVVVVSVTGTLYTDILTDRQGVPLAVSTSIFGALLAVTFGVWYARERTLSIHSIVTTPRESFYWFAVLVTFALGTATGDWSLTLTGWGPGTSILLPLTLIAIVAGLWRFGAQPVLTFWVAYILTRPLGANIGDFLASPRNQQGLGLGTLGTSVLFLAAIALTVAYLTVSKVDVLTAGGEGSEAAERSPQRERIALIALVVVAVATAGLLTWTDSRPHVNALDAEEGNAPTCSTSGTLSPTAAASQVTSSFPAADVTRFADITRRIDSSVQAGDASAASTAATDLETAWDDRQDALVAADCQAWTYVDQRIDPVLSSVRASTPDPAAEKKALAPLEAVLGVTAG